MTDLLKIEAEMNAQVVATIYGQSFTRGDFQSLFDMVADKANWKNAFDVRVVLTAIQAAAMAEAVAFFTGGAPEIFRMDAFDGGLATYRVMGHGYYHHVGA